MTVRNVFENGTQRVLLPFAAKVEPRRSRCQQLVFRDIQNSGRSRRRTAGDVATRGNGRRVSRWQQPAPRLNVDVRNANRLPTADAVLIRQAVQFAGSLAAKTLQKCARHPRALTWPTTSLFRSQGHCDALPSDL